MIPFLISFYTVSQRWFQFPAGVVGRYPHLLPRPHFEKLQMMMDSLPQSQ